MSAEPPDELAPNGQRMSYWIAVILRDERERAGVNVKDIGKSLDVDPRTITRLERGRSMGRDIDGFVAAYAYLVGIDDAREFWLKAARRFRDHGSPPQFAPINGAEAAFAQEIRREALGRSEMTMRGLESGAPAN